MYAYINRGKYKDKIALITKGNLNEDKLQYPKGWFTEANEYFLAKELTDALYQAKLDNVLRKYVHMSDASKLISKYMGELGQREFQGGCCG